MRTDTTTVAVAIDQFRGTLDKLVDLVRRHGLPLTSILVSNVTAQLLEQAEQLELDDAGEAIVLAAWLVKAKSKMLLPAAPAVDPDAPRSEDDRRAELLSELALIRALVGTAEDRDTETFAAGAHSEVDLKEWQDMPPLEEVAGDDGLSIEDLAAGLEASSKVLPEPEPHRVEALIEEIRARVRQGPLHFQWFCGEEPGRIIAGFLALMELIRLRAVRADQEEPFGDIIVESGPHIYIDVGSSDA